MPVFHEEHHSAIAPPARDPYLAFREKTFTFFTIGSFVAVLGRQMTSVAVGYETHLRTHSAMALGLIGLAGALPIIFLALPAGQLADRTDRRWLILISQLLGAITSLALAGLSQYSAGVHTFGVLQHGSRVLSWLSTALHEKGAVFGPEIPLYFAILLLNGAVRTFGWAARTPFMASLVSRHALTNAITWNSSLFEVSCVLGPALGGFLLARFGFPLVYLLDALAGLVFSAFLFGMRVRSKPEHTNEHPLADLLSGVRFVLQKKTILATITLDLFAVLLGGATALLPIYADMILLVGAHGIGWLRAAQSIGAIGMALALAHLPPMRKAGVTLLWAVAGFGAATIVFGLSRHYWLSLAALAVAGACDNVSVVVRQTLVQLLTPDAMRGRVAAVNNIFIGSSNELGALESGLTAARFGPVASVVGGGIGTILVVLGVRAKWPNVLGIGALSTPKPEDAAHGANPGA